MALNRRQFMLGLPVGCALLQACASGAVSPSSHYYAEIARSRNASAKDTILVCMPETPQTLEVWSSLRDELGKNYNLVALKVEDRGARSVIEEGIRRHRPASLVLMNNPTVAAYNDYQHNAKSTSFPPAVIVMTSFLDAGRLQVRGATGITYEVPLITVVTNLRKLIDRPIERIGVIHRPELTGFVERQTALAAREQIGVVREVVGSSPNASELKRALRRLKERAGAVWVLNDDHLLSPQLITEAWLPGLNERPWSPTIVGAASLVSPLQSFGTFAVLPDHAALGSQAASLIFDIADNGWELPTDAQTQLPVSTTTTLDLAQVRERFALRTDALRQVDRVLDR
ncbi:MAG TPA: hypothetical protein VFK05_06585 [Polyangiaceae bacterium]|nr:hypothetical protein [Polyangiaceae bacterium]